MWFQNARAKDKKYRSYTEGINGNSNSNTANSNECKLCVLPYPQVFNLQEHTFSKQHLGNVKLFIKMKKNQTDSIDEGINCIDQQQQQHTQNPHSQQQPSHIDFYNQFVLTNYGKNLTQKKNDENFSNDEENDEIKENNNVDDETEKTEAKIKKKLTFVNKTVDFTDGDDEYDDDDDDVIENDDDDDDDDENNTMNSKQQHKSISPKNLSTNDDVDEHNNIDSRKTTATATTTTIVTATSPKAAVMNKSMLQQQYHNYNHLSGELIK